MRRVQLSSLVIVLLALFATSARADVDLMKLVEIQGKADVYDPRTSQWTAQPKTPYLLGVGFRLRTYPNSTAEITLDSRWERLIHLSENSRISILDEHMRRISLDEGYLYLLMEGEDLTGSALKILTRDALIELSLAGIGVGYEPEGTRLRVFADQATAYPKKDGRYGTAGKLFQEGFQVLLSSSSEVDREGVRMDFDDYWKWQAWLKKRYAQKDKLFSKRVSS